jgi:hypothetical protein
MSDEFLKALVDALAPGGELGVDIAAPSASACRIHELLKEELENPGSPLLAVIERIAMLRGVPAAVALRQLQDSDPDGLTRLVSFVLTAYYQAPAVVEAFGWPARPPQPQGHALAAELDEALLAPVRSRPPFWRAPLPACDLDLDR